MLVGFGVKHKFLQPAAVGDFGGAGNFQGCAMQQLVDHNEQREAKDQGSGADQQRQGKTAESQDNGAGQEKSAQQNHQQLINHKSGDQFAVVQHLFDHKFFDVDMLHLCNQFKVFLLL